MTKQIRNAAFIKRAAAAAGLRVRTSRPGDGRTRYQFSDERAPEGSIQLFYAAGPAEAEAFIRGWMQGRNREIIK